jgi:hypothetical protein
MMTLEQFSERISQEVESAKEILDEGNVLDLRAGRSPYHPWDDLEVFYWMMWQISMILSRILKSGM